MEASSVHHRRQRGIGFRPVDLGGDTGWPGDGDTSNPGWPDDTGWPGDTPTDDGQTTAPWWLRAIVGAEKTVSNIFSPYQTSAAQAYAQQQSGYNPNTALVRTNQGSGLGVRVDSSGIYFGNSRIGWVWIIGGVGILFLLQSPGYSRRRNPVRKSNPAKKRKR